MCSADAESRLKPLRRRIDELDGQLVSLLSERAEVVEQIGRVKQEDQSQIYAPDREHHVLEQVRQRNQGPLPDGCLTAIWREIMSGSFALERSLRIGYLGPPGSFSHLAARRKFGASVQYLDVATIADVFKQIVSGRVDIGLVPIENSSQGGIGETLDAFVDSTVNVCAEVLIGVHHNLLSNGALDAIARVYSKPEALSQCRNWLNVNLPKIELIAAASTSKAAELAASDPQAAAVSSALATEIYDIKMLQENIEDNPNNVTRFFVLAKSGAKATGDDKTAIMFTTASRVGALSAVLDVLRDYKLNLTHIDKRPSKRVNWEYYFFVDFEGHESQPPVAKAIEAARSKCSQLTVLGSFPRAQEVL